MNLWYIFKFPNKLRQTQRMQMKAFTYPRNIKLERLISTYIA